VVDDERGSAAGGIVALAVLCRTHRGPLTADFRHLYGTSLADSGDEFWVLVRELLNTLESRFHAVVAGWSGPVSGAQIVLMDSYDRFMQVHFKNAPAYPRPWNAPRRATKKLTDAEAMAILRPHKKGV